MALPVSGTLSYDGYAFDSRYKTKIASRPVYDDAQRTVKYAEIIITYTGWINAGAGITTTDTTLETLRAKLIEPGKVLIYKDKGFGNLTVNQGAIFDVNWGPKVRLKEFTPVGDSQTALITWEATVCIPECSAAVYKRAVMAGTYEVAYDIDKNGYQVITTTGSLEIPMTYNGASRRAPDSADDYRELVATFVPKGFQREQKYVLSKDRRVLSFTIIDTQLPNALPNFCTKAEVRHKVSSGLTRDQGAFTTWANTLSGTITVSPFQPRSVAWERFVLILRDRIACAKSSGGVTGPSNINVIVTKAEFEEDVFGTENRFSVTYNIIGASLTNILRTSGLWRPVPETNYQNWTASVSLTAAPYGNANVRFDKNSDVLIDLCNRSSGRNVYTASPGTTTTQDLTGSGTNSYTPGGPPATSIVPNAPPFTNDDTGGAFNSYAPGSPGSGAGAGPIINPLTSWLSYQCMIGYSEVTGLVRHKSLDAKVTPTNYQNDATKLPSIFAGTTEPVYESKSDTSDIIQRVQSPSAEVVLSGTATRLGFPVPPPRLLKVDGRDCYQSWQRITSGVVGKVGGVPIFATQWQIGYILPFPAKTLPTAANPVFNTEGSPGTGGLFIPG